MATARLGILLFFFAFLVFVADGRLPEGKTDSVASRTIPFSILGSGSLYLDPVRDVAIDMFKPDWPLQCEQRPAHPQGRPELDSGLRQCVESSAYALHRGIPQ